VSEFRGAYQFSTTEGSIKKTLEKFKDQILRKQDEKIATTSRKELDIFLTKTETTSKMIRNIIVELKRPSINLGKNELDQIKEYMRIVLDEPSCNGNKMQWTFYLIGCKYNQIVEDEIESHKSSGDERDGLVHIMKGGSAKLYVQKWTDIINVNQKSKYSFLQEKLKIELEKLDNYSSQEVTEEIIGSK